MITDSDMFGTTNGHGSVAYIVSTVQVDSPLAVRRFSRPLKSKLLDLVQYASTLYSSRGCQQCKRGFFALFLLCLRLCMASHFVSATRANSLYGAQGLKIFHADASMTEIVACRCHNATVPFAHHASSNIPLSAFTASWISCCIHCCTAE